MFFWLKKLIAFWLMPLPFCLSAMAVGALLTFSRKRARAGRTILPGDTEEEAEAVQKLVHGARVALVTSAWHMPRSVALFHAAGLDPLPCPADFKSHSGDTVSLDDLFWDVGALDRSTCAVREHIG